MSSRRVFPEASADLFMCTGGRGRLFSTVFQVPICPGDMGQREDLKSESHFNRGLLEISHERHVQEGGRGGKAFHCAMGTLAAPQQGDLKGKGGTSGLSRHDMEGFVSWWFRQA